MSFSTGSMIFDGIIDTLQSHVSDFETRVAIYRDLIEVFKDFDCDNLDECVGRDKAFDKALNEAD